MADHALVSRRHLAGAGAALLTLVGTSAALGCATEADAELIALCAEIDALEELLTLRGLQEDEPGSPEEDAYGDLVAAAREQQATLTRRICALPCTTRAGLRALGATLVVLRGWLGLEGAGAADASPNDWLLNHMLSFIKRDPASW